MKAAIALMAGLGAIPKGPPPLAFDVPDGTYSVDNVNAASFTINATEPVVWTWSKAPLSVTVSSNVISGDTASSITFTLTTDANGATQNATVTAHSGDHTWTINLLAEASGTQ